ncbi:MAG: hypothetical protein MZU95_13255 [Desulfomicrobium escambiense]|nr:hypothetical protein [Desulfomicrobium escambiense]
MAIQVLGPESAAEALSAGPGEVHPDAEPELPESRSTENAAYSYLDSPASSTINQDRSNLQLPRRQTRPCRPAARCTLDFTGYRTTTNQTGNDHQPPLRHDAVGSASASPCSRTSAPR